MFNVTGLFNDVRKVAGRAIEGLGYMIVEVQGQNEIGPKVNEFCDALSSPYRRETSLDDNAFAKFRARMSQAVLADHQGPMQWGDVAMVMTDAFYALCDDAFANDQSRYQWLAEKAQAIKNADMKTDRTVSLRIGARDYTPLGFMEEICACASVADFRERLVNKSRSQLSTPVLNRLG